MQTIREKRRVSPRNRERGDPSRSQDIWLLPVCSPMTISAPQTRFAPSVEDTGPFLPWQVSSALVGTIVKVSPLCQSEHGYCL
jgi:hypothetical protein